MGKYVVISLSLVVFSHSLCDCDLVIDVGTRVIMKMRIWYLD